MMEGIHILNKTMITEIPSWAMKCMLIGFLMIALGSVLGFSVKSNTLKTIFGSVVGIGIVIIICICIKQPEEQTDRYRYEVTVGPYVRFTDIYEKYDVVERRGEIWVLEDKENE